MLPKSLFLDRLRELPGRYRGRPAPDRGCESAQDARCGCEPYVAGTSAGRCARARLRSAENRDGPRASTACARNAMRAGSAKTQGTTQPLQLPRVEVPLERRNADHLAERVRLVFWPFGCRPVCVAPAACWGRPASIPATTVRRARRSSDHGWRCGLRPLRWRDSRTARRTRLRSTRTDGRLSACLRLPRRDREPSWSWIGAAHKGCSPPMRDGRGQREYSSVSLLAKTGAASVLDMSPGYELRVWPDLQCSEVGPHLYFSQLRMANVPRSRLPRRPFPGKPQV